MTGKQSKARHHHTDKKTSKTARLRARTKDMDQIVADLDLAASSTPSKVTYSIYDDANATAGERYMEALDAGIAGGARNYCVHCARHFIDDKVLERHLVTKEHKRRVKLILTEKPYTKEEADAAAGLSTNSFYANAAIRKPVVKNSKKHRKEAVAAAAEMA